MSLGATPNGNGSEATPPARGLLAGARAAFHDHFLKILIDYPFLIGLGLIALLAELGYAILNIATLPLHLQFDLHAPEAIGYVLATFLLVEAIFKSPMGAIADRVGRRPMMVLGPLFSSLCCLIMYTLNHVWEFVVIHGLNGLGFAAFWPACFSTIGDRVRKKDMTQAMSVFNLTYLMGVALGPLAKTLTGNQDIRVQLVSPMVKDPTLQLRSLHHLAHGALDMVRMRAIVTPEVMRMREFRVLAEAAKYHITNRHRFPFLMVAALFVLTALLSFILVPSRARQLEEAAKLEDEDDEPPANLHAPAGMSLIAQVGVGMRIIPWMMVIAFFIFMGIGFVSPIGELYMIRVYNVTEREFGLILAPVAAMVALLALPLGRMGDRWGSIHSIRWGMGGCAVAMWLAAFEPLLFQSHSMPPFFRLHLVLLGVFVVLFIFVGLGFIMAMPAWMARVTEMAPPNLRGAVLGAASMAQGIGALIGTVLGGHLWADFRHRFPEAPVFACALMLSVGTIVALWHLHEPKTGAGEPDKLEHA